MSKKPDQAGAGQSIPSTMREKHDAIVALIDEFAREHLNEEYRLVCRRLAGVLARKRSAGHMPGVTLCKIADGVRQQKSNWGIPAGSRWARGDAANE